MNQTVEMIVDAQDEGIRVDAYLREHTEFSRSRISSLIQEGALEIDGRLEFKPARKLAAGERLCLLIPQTRPAEIVPQDIPLDILYQDSDVVIINKPCGMVVHPAAGNEDRTLVNALMFHIKDLSGIGGEMRPGIVHRLDKDTSGLILVAKNDRAHTIMSEQFKSRSTEKHYRAVAYGHFPQPSGLIDAPIARHPSDRKKMAIVAGGKPSQTEWTVIRELKNASYLDVHLLTGRTHQIRVHTQSVGHPLLGDVIYAPHLKLPVHIPRLMLHAYSLSFDHPTTGKRMEITAPLPKKFTDTLGKLES